jgi:hypothetical protein
MARFEGFADWNADYRSRARKKKQEEQKKKDDERRLDELEHAMKRAQEQIYTLSQERPSQQRQ